MIDKNTFIIPLCADLSPKGVFKGTNMPQWNFGEASKEHDFDLMVCLVQYRFKLGEFILKWKLSFMSKTCM